MGIRWIYRIPNVYVRELSREKKGLDEKVYESVLWWFGHIERLENSNVAKTVG